ncbi:MAG: UDP-N-acetylmuramate dehydrogenase [Acidobacteria bacterium]|nr:UDP-N-acetylmuramate dehydrogenase [Acidobacteriota bacterium]
MHSFDEARARLDAIPQLQVTCNEPLAAHVRFGFGGPARVFADTADEAAFLAALGVAHGSGLAWLVIGSGTNLIVSDKGFPGIVLRYRGARISRAGQTVRVEAGAALQSLVDFAVAEALQGIEVMTGIPGNVGAAVYGNAGAYGASISDRISSVRFHDGLAVREVDHAGCRFRYRDSIFKQRRLQGEPWLILSAELTFPNGDGAAMKAKADAILATRNAKFPPEMKCAGSIFKNLLLSELPEQARRAVPESVVKGGKVPAAWFLEQAGAKGLAMGGIRVTDYHSNTLYNAGGGTAAEFCGLVRTLKGRVLERFGLALSEEVQYIGFDPEELP